MCETKNPAYGLLKEKPCNSQFCPRVAAKCMHHSCITRLGQGALEEVGNENSIDAHRLVKRDRGCCNSGSRQLRKAIADRRAAAEVALRPRQIDLLLAMRSVRQLVAHDSNGWHI